MKPNLIYSLILFALFLTACAAEPTPIEPTPAEATPTPDPCTGWTCTLEGVVYLNESASGNELAGIPVNFKQVSNCSPTKGEYQAITGEDGRFSFEVFLHDTDGFVFEVNSEGNQPARVKFGGFDCLYCACDPVEIVLTPAE